MENRIHFVFGDNDFIAKSIAKSERSNQYRSQFCLHADDISAIKSYVDNSKKDIEPKLLILDNLHLLGDLNMRNLDFIFRLSDHHREINNLDIFLVVDNHFFDSGNDNILNESIFRSKDEIVWRTYLSQRFNSKTSNFNGIAFSGRVQTFYIQDSVSAESGQNANSVICDSLMEKVGAELKTELNASQFMGVWNHSTCSKFIKMIRPSDKIQFTLALLLPFTFFYHLFFLWKRIHAKQ